ncbi:SDR family oxidoreductase [Oceanicola sp. D3]|nr:UDP-glucuronic acid decarboxylase family protein [Oceanicola sp. D3]QDC11526.1 SDR family oxidoreductase [Oceanicola sp. D3]
MSSVGVRERRIIVAGGAGFIGSHLCDRLIDAGHSVLCLDNLMTGSMDNIAHLASHPRFQFRRHDVIEPAIVKGPVAEIYNLASPASPLKYQEDPIHTFKTSVWGALNLLELAREKGARILQSSTSEVYGDPTVSPQPESYHGNVNTTGPRACYDEGKRAAETLFYEMSARHGVEVRIARIFNTYGPRLQAGDGRVVSTFIDQALDGAPLTINGDGSQTRSFCYVDDLVEGLMRLMANDEVGSAPVNLGNPDERSISDAAALVLAATGSKSELTWRAMPQDDPLRRCPDISRAQELLDWRPTVSFEEGLQRMIAHMVSERARQRPAAGGGAS